MAKFTAIKNQNVITIKQGCDYVDSVTINLNLTGYTVTSQIRDLNGILKCTFDCDVTAGSTSSTIARTLTNMQTADLTPNDVTNYVWGIKLQSGAFIQPEVQGGVLVLPTVVLP